jgi:hypothetical protein
MAHPAGMPCKLNEGTRVSWHRNYWTVAGVVGSRSEISHCVDMRRPDHCGSSSTGNHAFGDPNDYH